MAFYLEFMHRKKIGILLAALIFIFGSLARGQTTTNMIGFTGPEIFPIDEDIGLLHAADLDGDKLNDLIVADNLRSKIVLLYNQTGKTNRAEAEDSSYSG